MYPDTFQTEYLPKGHEYEEDDILEFYDFPLTLFYTANNKRYIGWWADVSEVADIYVNMEVTREQESVLKFIYRNLYSWQPYKTNNFLAIDLVNGIEEWKSFR